VFVVGRLLRLRGGVLYRYPILFFRIIITTQNPDHDYENTVAFSVTPEGIVEVEHHHREMMQRHFQELMKKLNCVP